MPGLIYVLPKKFAKTYPDLVAKLKDNQQRLVVHYDTYWTLRHLSQLPEFGGGLNSSEHGNFVSLWDCAENQKYMKDIWFFKEKVFENTLGWKWFERIEELVLGKLKQCILTYSDATPTSDPMKHEVTITTSSGEETIKHISLEDMPKRGVSGPYYLTVPNLIKDYDSYYWFEDAISDIQYFTMTHPKDQVRMYLSQTESHSSDLSAEKKTLSANKASGHGRYVYGHSLMQYADDRSCNATGVVECPCRT